MNNEHKNFEENEELEARIVASVLGEATPFEVARLDQLIASKPELAVFKRRIEAIHGLAGIAAKPDQRALRMSEAKRVRLLNALGAPIAQQTSPGSQSVVVAEPRKAERRPWKRALTMAAGLMVGLAVPMLYRGNFGLVDDKQASAVLAEEDLTETTALQDGLDPAAKRLRASIAERRSKEQSWAGAAAASQPEHEESSSLSTENIATRDDNIVELSPFVVEASREQGYMASSSLAGSRISSSSPDLKSPLSIDLPFKDSAIGSAADGLKGSYAPSRPNSILYGYGSSAVTPPAEEAVWSGSPGAAVDDSFFGDGFSTAPANMSGLAARAPSGTQGPIVLLEQSAPAGPAALGLAVPAPKVEGDSAGAETKGDRMVVKKQKAEAAAKPADFGETDARKEPVSTFSLHVSDTSYKFARASVMQGILPDPGRVRTEEFYNAFSYGDPSPQVVERVFCRIEQSRHPYLQQRNFLRIAMKVPATGRLQSQPLRLTLLLDTSGSMEREDRSASVLRAVEVLASLLGPNDRVSLIGFSRQPRLLANGIPGDEAVKLVDLINRLPAEGGTNLEEALKLASEQAIRHRDAGAQNRVILLTDGAANLGDAEPERLAKAVESLRQAGVAFDACAVGMDDVGDEVLEALTRKGDGRYYVLNTPDEADAGFAAQIAGALRPAAENVKVQVRFNPSRVRRHRLIGFEKHRLNQEDFRNDAVDAAELAAEESAIALYEVEAAPDGQGDLGEVFVRFRESSTRNMLERSWNLPYDPSAVSFDQASPQLQLTGLASLTAEKLKGGERAASIQLSDFAGSADRIRGHYASDPRIQEFVQFFEKLRGMTR